MGEFGSSGMGMRKHGRSGRAPKSPRYRMQTKLELQDEEKIKSTKKRSPLKHSSVPELFGRTQKPKRKKHKKGRK